MASGFVLPIRVPDALPPLKPCARAPAGTSSTLNNRTHSQQSRTSPRQVARLWWCELSVCGVCVEAIEEGSRTDNAEAEAEQCRRRCLAEEQLAEQHRDDLARHSDDLKAGDEHRSGQPREVGVCQDTAWSVCCRAQRPPSTREGRQRRRQRRLRRLRRQRRRRTAARTAEVRFRAHREGRGGNVRVGTEAEASVAACGQRRSERPGAVPRRARRTRRTR